MFNKSDVHEAAVALVRSKLDSIQQEFDNLQESLMNETKSSAGDKHETGRAMAQLEQEKLSRQLSENRRLLDNLLRIDPYSQNECVGFGSLVRTSRGDFFISVGIGLVRVLSFQVFCITAGSPMGQKLLEKQKGDSFEMNGELTILSVI